MVLRTLSFGVSLCLAAVAATNVTFNKDVNPILQKRCQSCHRPGEVGPMALLTYQQARPWAKAMREAVLLKKMPPWFADPHYGAFSNNPSLSQSEIDTFVNWAAAGAPEGDAKDLGKPVEFVDGWNIGKPDVVVEMPNAFPVPATGYVDYQTIVIPTHFKQDMWIQAAELRPGNRAVVHHVTAFARQPGSFAYVDAQPGVPFRQDREKQRKLTRDIDRPEYIVGYTPGRPASLFVPGEARLIKAGSDIVLSLHYTPNGKATEDRTKIGFIFAKEPPKRRVVNVMLADPNILIPPGEPNYRTDASLTLQEPATLVRLWPHMHTRGKFYEYRVVFPTSESQVVLRVPNFDFGWQLSYNLEKPLYLPKGTRIEGTAYFDNSPNNPNNPDPKQEVHWGEQSWDEMSEGYMDMAVEPNIGPGDLRRVKETTAALN
jgi:hypothetical protein